MRKIWIMILFAIVIGILFTLFFKLGAWEIIAPYAFGGIHVAGQ